MEINFLVFPAPKCNFTAEDLKGELIWIPYGPNIFNKDKKQINHTNETQQKTSDTTAEKSQLQLNKFKSEFQNNFFVTQSKPLTKISFQKQFPLNPPDQQPNDLSQTVYDEEIDEIMQKSSKRLGSPQNLDIYPSGNFMNKNCFSTQNLQQKMNTEKLLLKNPHSDIIRFSTITKKTYDNQQVKITNVLSSQKASTIKLMTDEDIDQDLSIIQAEEILNNQKPSIRINEFTYKVASKVNTPSKINSPQSQFKETNLYGKIVEQNDSVKNSKFTMYQSASLAPKKFELSKKGVTKEIPCLYLKARQHARFLMLFFHGNGEDIHHSYQLLDQIRKDLNINILAMEYPGYGLYKGKPSEDAILQDASYLYQYLTKHSGIQEQDIIVFGRSIGSGPATYLASLFNPAMLVLMSPFLNLCEVIKHSYGTIASNLVQDRFKNKENIKKVQCPTFILHGCRDNIVPVSHSKELHRLCGGVCELNTPIQMDHVRFLFNEDLIDPLKQFMRANNLLDKLVNSSSMRKFI